jgi:2-polyprenyl-3-methyl-5-hydroxy-6-metoxy-1,4-benzoquinol methylase
MGISSSQGKSETFEWVKSHQESITTILDIGAGSGTYYNLLSTIKPFVWNGVEAWNSYIDEYKLEEKYNKIYNVDIRQFDWPGCEFDLTIAGDILEHITKEDAIILVERILNHSKTLIISIPIVHMPQDEINGNPYEVHVKDDWSHNEVLETWSSYIKDFWIPKGKKVQVGVYWLSK